MTSEQPRMKVSRRGALSLACPFAPLEISSLGAKRPSLLFGLCSFAQRRLPAKKRGAAHWDSDLKRTQSVLSPTSFAMAFALASKEKNRRQRSFNAEAT